MSKIRVGDEIIDLALCFAISITAKEIHFENGGGSGNGMLYRKGKELSDADFVTLSNYLQNQTNNAYTTVI